MKLRDFDKEIVIKGQLEVNANFVHSIENYADGAHIVGNNSLNGLQFPNSHEVLFTLLNKYPKILDMFNQRFDCNIDCNSDVTLLMNAIKVNASIVFNRTEGIDYLEMDICFNGISDHLQVNLAVAIYENVFIVRQ